MEPNPIRVIAFCSLILGSFFLARSISVKTPKYVLHELLAFKVNKSRFFRKYIGQKLDSVIGFLFFFLGFGLLAYLEVEALGERDVATGRHTGFSSWWTVVSVTVVAMFTIAFLLSRITRFFSNRIFVEHVRFMVETHGYPLESDDGLVRELGRVMRIPLSDEDTIESYCEKVRIKMKIPQPVAPSRKGRGALYNR